MVSPSLTLTDLTRDFSPRTQLAEAQRNPTRRLAETADAASLVAFLLSDEAAFINGAHLPVTGGSAIW
jgi:NAD(P)-dependent dehydrogenase (short-subunit alcohol dehydrogenase family)